MQVGGILMGGDLFQRFFLRFLIGLVIAFLLFLPLVHVFQKRVVFAEWGEDLGRSRPALGEHLDRPAFSLRPPFQSAERGLLDPALPLGNLGRPHARSGAEVCLRQVALRLAAEHPPQVLDPLRDVTRDSPIHP